MPDAADASPRFWARSVGVLYLLMAAMGSIPALVGRVPIADDAAATAAAILAHPTQVYAAFAAGLLVVICYLPVPVLFYKLLEPVNDTLSLTAAFAGLAGCVVQGLACLFRIAPLIVLRSGHSSGISQQQLQAFAWLLLKLYTPAYNISLVFFAVAMVVIGCLVFQSTFLPRLLGVLAVISGIGWLSFLWPPLAAVLWPRVLLPLDIGEVALVLWLLIAGVNLERWRAQAGASRSHEPVSSEVAQRASAGS